jgi:large-conductance mechanosensitive channel
MGKWAEGRTLSKKCWSLLGQNKYFLWFPVIGLILALLPLAVFGIPALVLLAYDSELLGIILAALCLVFVNYAFTLSGAALVSAADEELAGKDASVGYGFGKAFGKLVPLFVWAIIRAVVSAFFAALRGNNSGAAGVASNIFAAIGAAAWSIVTFFVTPYIMFHDSNAVAAIKESAKLVKEKWGTQLTGGIRIGVSVALIILPAIALVVIGFIMLSGDGGGAAVGGGLIAVGAVLFLIGLLIGNTLQAIFSVALYRFATGSTEIAPFTATELQGVLRVKS